MHEIDFKGVRAHYRTWGQGRPVVFLHSGGGSGAQWEKVVLALGVDCHAIAPDLLGFGETETWRGAAGLTHDVQAELVANVIDAGAREPVDIVGHSYGGATAVRLAVSQPHKVRSLVLIEPILNNPLKEGGDPLFEESERVGRAFVAHMQNGRPDAAWELFIDARNGAGTWARMSERRREQFVSQSDQGRDAMISNQNNRTTSAECRALGMPTTIVCGAETTPADRRATELLRAAMGDARYVLLPGAGHMSPLTHPGDVARVVREHLARVPTIGP